MLDTVTLLSVTAIAVAFAGLFLSLAGGSASESRTMRVWGGSLLVGASGLVVSAAGQVDSNGLIDAAGTMLFLTATGIAWAGARLFTGRRVRVWSPLLPPGLWLAGALLAPPGDLRLALACLVGAGTTTLAAAELWHARTERLPSLPAVFVLLAVHAILYAGRGVVALTGTLRTPWWSDVVMDVMVVESLLHALGVAFLVVAMLKERVEARARNELRSLALSDGLTGIANRRHLDMKLAVEAARLSQSDQTLGLMLIDIDHFKRFNDANGHPEGDRCLRAVAATINDVLTQPGSLVARYGGEEFAAVIPGVGMTEAVHRAEAVRGAVERMNLPHPQGGYVTVSIGVSVLAPPPGGLADAATLLDGADNALYAAKAGGRNRVSTWTDTTSSSGHGRGRLSKDAVVA